MISDGIKAPLRTDWPSDGRFCSTRLWPSHELDSELSSAVSMETVTISAYQAHGSASSVVPPPQVPGQRNYGYPDYFIMYSFKVQPCTRLDTHTRDNCPYVHNGDVLARRHPSLYQALLCPEARAVSHAHAIVQGGGQARH